MAISDELNRIILAKAGIRSALGEKGLVIGESSTLDEYPALIQTMQTGGGYDVSTVIDLIEGDVLTFNIPSGTGGIGANAFNGCHYLRNITIPNTVGYISANAFNYCSLLNNLIIPNSIGAIGPKVFYQNTNLTDLVILRDTPPTLDSNNEFSNNNLKIYVKNAAVDSYKNAGGNWNDVSTRITALASMSYDSQTYTVTALGRNNLELYVDASLCNSSTYTFTLGAADATHTIMVKSVDPSLGVLDTSTMEVTILGSTPSYSAEPAINMEELIEETELPIYDDETGEPTGETETVTTNTGYWRVIGDIEGDTQYVSLNVNGSSTSNPTNYDYLDYEGNGFYETDEDDPNISITVIATAQEPGKTATTATAYFTNYVEPDEPDEPDPEE